MGAAFTSVNCNLNSANTNTDERRRKADSKSHGSSPHHSRRVSAPLSLLHSCCCQDTVGLGEPQ